jgi:dUTP pyrophosphatase
MHDCEIQLIKTHPDAILPTQAHEGDNCWDMYACEDATIPGSYGRKPPGNEGNWGGVDVGIGHGIVPVGLKVAFITPGYGFVFRGRSGLGFKKGIMPHFGEIDNGYRGDLGVKLYNLTATDVHFKKGDRIAQIKIEKNYKTKMEFTEEQVESVRGEGGFGSTGS